MFYSPYLVCDRPFVRVVGWRRNLLRTVCIASVYLLKAHVYHLHIPFVTSTLSYPRWNSSAAHFALSIHLNSYDAFVTLRFARVSTTLYPLLVEAPDKYDTSTRLFCLAPVRIANCNIGRSCAINRSGLIGWTGMHF